MYERIGEIVHWHRQGNLDAKPCAAFITDICENDPTRVKLNVIVDDQTAMAPSEEWVLHADSQEAITKPDLKRDFGLWKERVSTEALVSQS